MEGTSPTPVTAREWRWLALGLLLAAAARWVAFTGWQGSDDLGFDHFARAMVRGTYRPENYPLALRVGYLAPIAALKVLFGEGYRVAVLYNLASGLGCVVMAWALARLWWGPQAAGWAAAVAALAPTSFTGATELHTDVPVGFWMALSVYCLERGYLAAAGRRWPWWLATGLIGGFVHLHKEMGFFILPIWALLAWRRRGAGGFLWGFGGFSAVCALEMLWYRLQTGDFLYRLHITQHGRHEHHMELVYPAFSMVLKRVLWGVPAMALDVSTPAWLVLGPFLLAAAGAGILLWRASCRESGKPLAWALCMALGINFWPLQLKPYVPGFQLSHRIMEPVVLPCAILIGMGIQHLGSLPGRRAWARRGALGLLALLALGCAFSWYSAQIPAYSLKASYATVLAAQEHRVYADPRTCEAHIGFDAERGSKEWLPLEEGTPALARGSLVVLDRVWIRNLEDWWGYRPPAWVSEGRIPPQWTRLASIPAKPFAREGAPAGAEVYRVGEGKP